MNTTVFGIVLLVLFVVLLVKTLKIRNERKMDKWIANRIGMTEKGQGLMAIVIILAILVCLGLAIAWSYGVDCAVHLYC